MPSIPRRKLTPTASRTAAPTSTSIHFPKGETAAGQRLLVADHVQRRLLLRRQPAESLHGQCAQRPEENADGSLDLYIQNESPGKDKEANWLPAPKDKFVLMMRLYWPKENPPSIIDGTWKPPAVVKAN